MSSAGRSEARTAAQNKSCQQAVGAALGMSGLKERCERWFDLAERGSDVRTELRAGLTTFLTMSYIMLVNPQVLCALTAGNTPPVGAYGNAVVATALSSALGSALIGVFANAPFVVAPGVGLSAYLAYGLVGNGKLTWQQAMTCCCLSGIVVCLLALAGGTRVLTRMMPRCIKLSIVAGMGLLIALIGLHSVGLVAADANTVVRLGALNSQTGLALGGLLLLSVLEHRKVKGGILLAIVTVAVAEWWRTDTWPASLVELPRMTYGAAHNLDWDVGSWPAQPMVTGLFSFLFVAVFDVSGVTFGMARLAGLASDAAPDLPGKRSSLAVFLSTGSTSIAAAAMGCTPCIVGVESSAGILDGGRSGLVALTAAALFLVSIFFAPLFAAVPSVATSPVLIFIGAQMVNEATNIDWLRIEEAVPSFLTVAMMPCTFSIGNGIMFGVAASAALWVTTGQALRDFRRRRGGGDEGSELKEVGGAHDGGAPKLVAWWGGGIE